MSAQKPVSRVRLSRYEAVEGARQHTLGEIQRNQRLAGILPVAVDAKRDGGSTPQRAAKTDNAKEDGRNDPPIPLGRAPPEAHEADASGDSDRDSHDESELRFVDAAVAAAHEADDDVRDLAGDGGAEDAADEGAEVDEAGAEGGEVVGVGGAVDAGDGFGEDDEPADAEGIDHRAPEHGRVSEEDEGPEGDVQPAVVAETAVPGFEGLREGLGRLGLEEGGIPDQWEWSFHG